MAIWGSNRRGDRYAVDYAIGTDPSMRRMVMDIKNVVSIEGHINSKLAEHHSVPIAQVHVNLIVRINE